MKLISSEKENKHMDKETESFLVTKDISVREAMKNLGKVGEKTLFVLDGKGELFGALTDGDIRKWILKGGDLGEAICKICNISPKFVDENYNIEEVKRLMLDLKIECVPVLKNSREIKEVLTWDSVFAGKIPRHKGKLNIQVVIMAGGKGLRLDPFTRILPKPLIPIGDKPIIEVIMDKFAEYGINDFYLSINHKSKMIKSYFEDMDGVYNVHYIEEKSPLGTAGSLRLLKDKINDPFLVTNCDIIIEADYSEIVKFHNDNDYDMTIVVSCKHYVIPYGICEIENGGELKSIKEKPEHHLLVNTGMYVMKSKMLDLIPEGEFFNINDLIEKAKEKRYKVGVFPIGEKCWIDIGQWEEYHKAVEKLKVE